MKVLSVRQPWAYAIFNLGKDVENRKWATDYRGPLLIHASNTPDRSGGFRELGLRRTELDYGAIIGLVQLQDCRVDLAPSSPWAIPGLWHWVLSDPVSIDPVPCTGRLKLFDPPELVRKRVERALRQ